MSVLKRHTKSLIAHELGHTIFSYLYDVDSYPSSMSLSPDEHTMGCVNFTEYENLPVADGSISKIKSSSYLGGLFGELLYNGKVRTMGIRCDMDELLTELRFVKNGTDGEDGHRYRRSRSKVFKELWSWFYTDRDRFSYGGMMKRWMECPKGIDGTYLTLQQFRRRLPITAAIYDKFLSQINIGEFKSVVDEIAYSEKKTIPGRSLQKFGRRIIPVHVMHPEDI